MSAELHTEFVAGLRRERTASEATLRALEADLAALARLAEGRPWKSIGHADIRSFVAREHRRGLAPSSLKRMLSSWRRFFAKLADDGLLESNPAAGVRAPRSGKRLPKALTPDEAASLLSAEPDGDIACRDAAMFEVAYSSALRVSELVGLDCGDVDAGGGTLTVRHGKGDREREVPLGRKAAEALKRWHAVRRRLALPAEGPLFTSLKGRRIGTRSAQLRLKRLASAAGIDGDVTPHMLRHSCASHLLQSSGDLRGVQEMLGHADVGSTQIYTHLDFQSLAKVYDRAHPRARRPGKAGAKP